MEPINHAVHDDSDEEEQEQEQEDASDEADDDSDEEHDSDNDNNDDDDDDEDDEDDWGDWDHEENAMAELEQLEPLHRAAFFGDEEDVKLLVAEDGRRLDAQILEEIELGDMFVEGCTPLMLAARKGHGTVVARLIGMGAEVGLSDADGFVAAHWACVGRCASTLALLLDAGASLDVRSDVGATLLMVAAYHDAAECVKLLLARCGDTLQVDEQDADDEAALHLAARKGRFEIVQLLVLAGANPIIRNDAGVTPLDIVRDLQRLSCIRLLQAAIAEPERPRLLLKARALLDAAVDVPTSRRDALGKGKDPAMQVLEAVAAAPVYLKERVIYARELPAVTVEGDDERLVACVKYALGLAGGGGWHEGPGPAPQGMLKELFVEVLELIVPKWDPARKGLPLGKWFKEEEGQEEEGGDNEEEQANDEEGDDEEDENENN